ncbi:hypothetical protein [Demequina sp.]|uniref:hypothetical protein n=1 Tax=Demequina sp. TaxID=2050685 RepID=UPI0025BC2689|nr:hypothetical protein [Demequina sp.]
MRSWFVAALQWLGLVVLLLLAVAIVLHVADAFPWTVDWDVWTVLTAFGTIGATLVALTLAVRSWIGDRKSTARLVSTWVTDDYQPREHGSSYRRVVQLHISNESNEPVFEAMANVHIGRHQTPLGPLAAPAPIIVLPPRRELVFNISVPLLAHDDSWQPRATLEFSDSRGHRWLRNLTGELQDLRSGVVRWSKSSQEGDERQLGSQETLFNPMLVAILFLRLLRDESAEADALSLLLAPEASRWQGVDWAKLREDLASYQPTSMVDYPASRIARVKLSGDTSLEGKTVEGHGAPLELHKPMFMTLILDPHAGWRVFGIGDHVPPDAIHFEGSLNEDIEPTRRGSKVEDD